MQIISLDIDDTITALPEYFSTLSCHAYTQGGKVAIISSRMDAPEIRSETEIELSSYAIRYDDLYLFKAVDDMPECPHEELDWQDQYLWQKVAFARSAGVSVHYDDDDRVLDLFRKYVPEIEVVDAKLIGVSE